MNKQHELHLLTFAQTQEDLGYEAELKDVFKEVHQVYLPKWKSAMNCLAAAWDSTPLQVLYFRSAEMRSKLNELLQQHHYDAIHVQHLRMSPYLKDRKDLPRILDMPDAFSLYWQRRRDAATNPVMKLVNGLEHKRLLRYEGVMKEYDMSLVCSREDLEYLKEVHHLDNINLLPNGVDVDTFKAGNHD